MCSIGKIGETNRVVKLISQFLKKNGQLELALQFVSRYDKITQFYSSKNPYQIPKQVEGHNLQILIIHYYQTLMIKKFQKRSTCILCHGEEKKNIIDHFPV
jgi:hypothetical protein